MTIRCRPFALFACGCLLAAACANETQGKHAHAAHTSDVPVSSDGADAAVPQTFHGLTQNVLKAVWGTSDSDMWAVGAQGTILHFDGQTLSAVDSGTTFDLNAVHGTGPDDVWVAGDQVTLHYDGDHFTQTAFGIDDETLLGVWAVAPDDVWTVGTYTDDRAGVLRHWNGDHWAEGSVPDCASLWKLWGSAPDDIWLVGTSLDNSGFVMRGSIEKFARMDFAGESLRGVWGSSAQDVWVVPYDSPAQHWNGDTWSSADAANNQPTLGAWSDASDDVWVVGLAGTILHYDGNAWTDSDSQTSANLWGVWGLSANDVWAAGGSGTLLRWNGQNWSTFATGM